MRSKVLTSIQKKIRSFDLRTLIELLESYGYLRRDIYFISNPNNASPVSLCEKIEFLEEAPSVRITLNIGLFSNNTPLPGFFMKYIETEEIDADRFMRFIGFFNNQLIHEFLRATLPEKNEDLFSNWRETHYHYLSLLGFESISTLWLIFKGCFPELVVGIQKNTRMIHLNTNTMKLGKDGLGPNSFIGERLEHNLSNFRITFTTEEEASEMGRPWPIEINRRLIESIYPILQRTDLHLTITLIIKNKHGHMHLSQNNLLGFDRIGQNSHPFQLILFHGFIKNLAKNIYVT